MIRIKGHMKGLKSFSPEARLRYTRKRILGLMAKSANEFTDMMMKNISFPYRGKEVMRELDWPFAARHYPSGMFGDRVHRQSGAMIRAWDKKKKAHSPQLTTRAGMVKFSRTVGFNRRKDAEGYKHAEWVILGTQRGGKDIMYPRLVVLKTLDKFVPRWNRLVKSELKGLWGSRLL